MSNGESVNPAPAVESKPEHHAARRARLAHEYEQVMAKAGVSTMDELLEKIVSGAQESVADSPAVPAAKGQSVDPLASIGPDTDVVYLCAEHSTFVMVHEHRDWAPPINQVELRAVNRGPWVSCPFWSDTGDAVFDTQRNVKYSQWNHFVLSRNFCEMLHQDPRLPIAKNAVIGTGDFKGWSGAASKALGQRTALENPDALREAVRDLLQRGGESVHLCGDYPGMEWCLSDSNPYCSDIPGGMSLKPFDAVRFSLEHKGA